MLFKEKERKKRDKGYEIRRANSVKFIGMICFGTKWQMIPKALVSKGKKVPKALVSKGEKVPKALVSKGKKVP